MNDEIGKVVKYPIITGVAVSLTGGLVNYLTKMNTTVNPNLGSMFRSFLLVSTVGIIVELGKEEKKLPFPR